MCKLRSIVCLVFLCLAALAAAQGSKNQTKTSHWQTLGGNEPLVIARGGFSGLFTDSSSAAYQLASLTSLRNVIFWCDVQLTKDGAGICFPTLTLDNSSDIALIFKTKETTYLVNGVSMHGWFSVDFTLNDLANIYSCFSHIGKNMSGQEKPLVISHKGSNGDYPDCTDLAYQRAISDGVDVLDCPVQMTKDGIPVCLGSINLAEFTLAAQSKFSNQMISIPELGVDNGIFTFNLTWSEIQGLQPAISNPFASSRLYRNPNNKNAGKYMTLSEFLDLANSGGSVSGVLIIIEDAAYLAEKEGLSVTDVVLGTLKNFSGSSQPVKKIMIQSTNSSVLIKFKKESNYELVYRIEESIRDVDNSTITEIKSFADSVVVSKDSVFPDNQAYLTGMTDIVQKLKAFKLSVYVQRFRNEFLSQAWDFFSDANVEINSFVMGAGIDGVITEFPGTAVKYKKNKCLGLGDKTPPYMSPVQPGSLMQLITPEYLPPAEAPNPVLTESDVVEPPLPAVAVPGPSSGNGNGITAPPPTPTSGQPEVVACIFLSSLSVLLSALALI